MKKLLVLCAALALSCGAYAQSSSKLGSAKTPRGFTTTAAPSALFWSKEVSLNGDNVWNAKVGPVSSSLYGFGANVAAAKVPGATVADIPAAPFGTAPLTQAIADQVAVNWHGGVKAQFVSKMSAYLRSIGVSHSYFSYAQTLSVATGYAPGFKLKTLVWSGSVDSTGRSLAGAPRIIDGDPTFVYAISWPSTTDAMLPSDWNFANAGKIQWWLLNKKMERITADAYVTVGSAYDNVTDISKSKSMGPVACFVDKTYSGTIDTNPGDAENPSPTPVVTNCVGGVTDVADLIRQTGASAGIAVYVNAVEPVYAEDTAGGLASPALGMTYDDRLWMCDKLQNSGNYGYLVRAAADMYYVTPSVTGPYNMELAKQETFSSLSPTVPFTQQVSTAALGGQHPDNVLISPVLNPATNTPDVWLRNSAQWNDAVYIAPIRTAPTTGTTNYMVSGGVTVSSTSTGAGATTRTIGRNAIGSGSSDDYVTFAIADTSAVQQFSMSNQVFDDYAYFEVNGHTVFAGVPGHLEVNGFYPGILGYQFFVPPQSTTCYDMESGQQCYTTSGFVSGTEYNYFEPESCQVQTGYQELGDSGGYPLYSTVDNRGTYIRGYNQGKGLCGPAGFNTKNGSNALLSFNDNHTANVVRDLRPYLVNGTNVIHAHTYVVGTGGWGFKISEQIQSCGTTLGIAEAPQPAPSNVTPVVPQRFQP